MLIDVTREEAPANLRASSRGNTEGASVNQITGRKAHAGGFVKSDVKSQAQPGNCIDTGKLESVEGVEFQV